MPSSRTRRLLRLYPLDATGLEPLLPVVQTALVDVADPSGLCTGQAIRTEKEKSPHTAVRSEIVAALRGQQERRNLPCSVPRKLELRLQADCPVLVDIVSQGASRHTVRVVERLRESRKPRERQLPVRSSLIPAFSTHIEEQRCPTNRTPMENTNPESHF